MTFVLLAVSTTCDRERHSLPRILEQLNINGAWSTNAGGAFGNARESQEIPRSGQGRIGDHPGRKEPTTGEINYPNVFRHIRDKGYDGILGMDHGNAQPGAEGEMAVIEAYRSVDPTGCLDNCYETVLGQTLRGAARPPPSLEDASATFAGHLRPPFLGEECGRLG